MSIRPPQIDDEREAQLNPRVAVPDHQRYLDWAAEQSLEVRQRLRYEADVRYGNGPLQTLDLFLVDGDASPVHVFIHGGYWRALDKSVYSYVAKPIVECGAIPVLVNYDLCPNATLDDIVAEIFACIAWVCRNARSFGGDPERITISGHSAGAHLAAATFARDWQVDGLPHDIIKAACLISGIYDLNPVLDISVNQDVRLSEEMAKRHSVMFQVPRSNPEVLVVVGAEEPPLWIKQSTDYAEVLRRSGLRTRYAEISGEHHFSITHRLAEPHHPVTKALLSQITAFDSREVIGIEQDQDLIPEKRTE